jgi:quercetin dioxygenase-like cupin family protein
MRIAGLLLTVCVVMAASSGAGTQPATADRSSSAGKVTPLILEKDEGEKRVWRPIEGVEGWEGQPGPFILKVDPRNGGSSHLVLGTEDLPPGARIDRHRHPGSDEILSLQNGSARVSLGDMVREVHGGATIFIPANTWIAVTNLGTDAISVVFIFSTPGFEGFMRAESVREGQNVTPLSKAEDAKIMKQHAHAVIYEGP